VTGLYSAEAPPAAPGANPAYYIAAALMFGLLTTGWMRNDTDARREAAESHHITLYGPEGVYCAWPSLVRAANGDLLVLFSRTEEHLGPDGAILSVRSTDNGITWLSPDTVFDTAIDDRESGLTVLRDGTILAHVWSTCHTRASYAALPPESYEQSMLARWSMHVSGERYLSACSRQGAWHIISHDDGKSWSTPLPGKDAVHGGIQLHDGSLLIASYREEKRSIGVYHSVHPESVHTRLATIAGAPSDGVRLGEPHILQLRSGRIIMMIRATAVPYDDTDPRCVLWESYSDDSGRTWVPPFATGLWGFPPHLLLLSDGSVLCTYGHRREPFGQRACISNDGVTWDPSSEVVLRDDAPNGDLGYPASVELDSLRILTVYYQPEVPAGTVQMMHPPDPGRRKPGILGTIWTRPGHNRK